MCIRDSVKANHMITPKRAAKVMAEGVDENGNPITQVKIRTVLTCRSHMGVSVSYTHLETKAAVDSGVCVVAKADGEVLSSESNLSLIHI